mmetsp:Transcript_12214/g.37438  ORF Transcript_12214/g.37438 Transcript_12214/m.37438 type:complete len:166 (-) Transcript_12214:1394-1891(-)
MLELVSEEPAVARSPVPLGALVIVKTACRPGDGTRGPPSIESRGEAHATDALDFAIELVAVALALSAEKPCSDMHRGDSLWRRGFVPGGSMRVEAEAEDTFVSAHELETDDAASARPEVGRTHTVGEALLEGDFIMVVLLLEVPVGDALRRPARGAFAELGPPGE